MAHDTGNDLDLFAGIWTNNFWASEGHNRCCLRGVRQFWQGWHKSWNKMICIKLLIKACLQVAVFSSRHFRMLFLSFLTWKFGKQVSDTDWNNLKTFSDWSPNAVTLLISTHFLWQSAADSNRWTLFRSIVSSNLPYFTTCKTGKPTGHNKEQTENLNSNERDFPTAAIETVSWPMAPRRQSSFFNDVNSFTFGFIVGGEFCLSTWSFITVHLTNWDVRANSRNCWRIV